MEIIDWDDDGYDNRSPGQSGSAHAVSSDGEPPTLEFVMRNGLLVPASYAPKQAKIGFY